MYTIHGHTTDLLIQIELNFLVLHVPPCTRKHIAGTSEVYNIINIDQSIFTINISHDVIGYIDMSACTNLSTCNKKS